MKRAAEDPLVRGRDRQVPPPHRQTADNASACWTAHRHGVRTVLRYLSMKMEESPMHFTLIDPNTWERKEYFDHYFSKVPCTYSMTTRLDIWMRKGGWDITTDCCHAIRCFIRIPRRSPICGPIMRRSIPLFVKPTRRTGGDSVPVRA